MSGMQTRRGPLNKEEKEKISHLHLLEKSIREISKEVEVPKSTVHNFVKDQENYGTKPRGRPRRGDEE